MEHLNRDIDALSDTASLEELAAATQKVLRTMAFYVSQSEAAVLEYREAWHDDYTDALYADAGKSRGGAAVSASVGRSDTTASAARLAGSRSERKTGGKGRRGGRGRGSSAASSREEVEAMIEASRAETRARVEAAHQGAVQRTASARPARANVPASLQAIMDGSHPSFKESDGFGQ